METFIQHLVQIKEIVWGIPLLLFILGTGVYLTILLRGVQIRYLGFALREVLFHKKSDAAGDISSLEALMTSLCGAIGTGSIVGVATGIAIGGFGAIFWMWVTAIIAMAIKYAESLLAVHFRHMNSRGEMMGGPMQYIEKGLGLKWLAVLFAVLATFAILGTGNLVQINSIAEALDNVWTVNPLVTGVLFSILTGIVLLGGVKAVARFAMILVPVMGFFYFVGGLAIIIMHYDQLPHAFYMIFSSAFQGQAALGGFTGSSILLAMQLGVSRSIFSNEAALGVSSIAAAAAQTDNAGRQALISMTAAVFSTLIICTVSALVFAVTGVFGQLDDSGVMLKGASMALAAFEGSLPGGKYVVTIGLILFAYTTMVAWAYYGEKCFEYLLGEKSIPYYRFLFTIAVIPGATLQLDAVWLIADIMNGLMVIPNLLALILLSGVIVKETKTFIALTRESSQLVDVHGV